MSQGTEGIHIDVSEDGFGLCNDSLQNEIWQLTLFQLCYESHLTKQLIGVC
jgi:hypothetical protein